MLSRRLFCGCLAGLAFTATAARAQVMEACEVVTDEAQKNTSPAMALAALRAGNERVLRGKSANCDRAAQVKATATEQNPFAAILGCIDSRDQHIGDIFAARVAGNIANVDIIGSLEYATKVAGARAILVLGHTGCGAIKAAVDHVKLGNITALLKNIEPALKAVGTVSGRNDSANLDLVRKVTEANVRLTAEGLVKRSKILKTLVDAGEIKIAGAVHDVGTGKVAWL
jgi:carbonic anhydrase